MLRSDLPIALIPEYIVDYDDAAGIDADQSPADVAVFSIPFKCTVLRAMLVVTETCAGATTTPVAVMDSRPTAGSDTDRGSADVASFVLSTTAQGESLYDDAGYGVELEPGEEVVVELTVQATGSGAAGHFRPVLLVRYEPEAVGNLANMVETA